MRKRVLKKTIKRQFDEVIGAFDIETIPSQEWIDSFPDRKKKDPSLKFSDGSLFGDYADGFLKYDDEEEYHRADTMLDMVKHILRRGNVMLYAHNAKGYEFKYMLKVLQEHYSTLKVDCILQGNHIIGMVIDHAEGKIQIRDSLSLIPMGLDTAAKKLNTKTQKGDIGLKEGEIYDRDNVKHQSYCMQDCQVTIEIVQKIVDLTFKVFGCGVGITTAGTALACFKSLITPGNSYHRMAHHIERFAREAYYGGYVYPGRSIEKHYDVLSIDRNASFAASMRDGVPTEKPRWVYEEEEGKLGIYFCEIHAPENVSIPCVPLRTKEGLKWPIGQWRAHLTSVEIDFARRQGYFITPTRGIVWDKVEFPFNEIIDRCEQIEVEQPELKEFIKLIRNALYGKFGQKFQVTNVIIGMPENPDGWYPLCSEDTGELSWSVWCQEQYNESEAIMPHWAAFITARARIWVFQTMLTVGMDHVFYGDTDSVKGDATRMKECIRQGILQVCCPKKDVPDSGWIKEYVDAGWISTDVRYGGSKIDEEYEWFQCLGPKVYHGVQKNGKDKMRAKGIPGKKLSHALYEHAYIGFERAGEFPRVNIRSSNSTGVLLKKTRASIQKDVTRRLTDFRNSKTWVVTEEGRVYPPVVYEI